MKKVVLSLFILLANLFATAQSGSITNINVSQRTDGSGLVDVHFNLSGPASSYFINMRVSFDAGVVYIPISMASMSGHVGPVNPGSNRHIVWNPTIDHPNRYGPATKLKIVAYLTDISNPCPGAPTVSDIDGNLYHTLQIGNQCWMASNLNVTRNPAGNLITRYCYNNDPNNCELYGGLYLWATVMNGAGSSGSNPSGVRGICPPGWHVPSDAEWTQLTNFLINNYVDITTNNVGNKLKSCRQQSSPLGGDCNTSVHPRWNSNATHYGTNDFGFSALPAGYRSTDGSVYYFGSYGYWWSSTENSSYNANAWHRTMRNSNGEVGRGHLTKASSFAVRCLRD